MAKLCMQPRASIIGHRLAVTRIGDSPFKEDSIPSRHRSVVLLFVALDVASLALFF